MEKQTESDKRTNIQRQAEEGRERWESEIGKKKERMRVNKLIER